MPLVIFLLLIAIPVISAISLYVDSTGNQHWMCAVTGFLLVSLIIGVSGILYLAYKGCGA